MKTEPLYIKPELEIISIDKESPICTSGVTNVSEDEILGDPD